MNIIDPTVQIILIIGIFIIAIPFVITIIKNKGEIKFKNFSLSLGHKPTSPKIKNNDTTLFFNYLDAKLDLIEQKFFEGYGIRDEAFVPGGDDDEEDEDDGW